MKNVLIYASLNALVGLIIGFFIAKNATGSGWEVFPVFSTLATFLVSFTAYYLFFVYYEKDIHFLLLGSMVVFFSHYFTFYFQFLYYNVTNKVFDNFQSSLGEPPAGIIDAIWISFMYSLLSLFMFGWVTMPLGVLISYLFRKK